MMKTLVLISVLIGLNSVAKAVRFDDDYARPTSRPSTTESLEKNLLTIFPMHLFNGAMVSLSLEKSKKQSGELNVSNDVLLNALDIQFNDLVSIFPEAIQSNLRIAWQDNVGITYSERGEHSIKSRPMGFSHVYGPQSFQLILDYRLKSLPVYRRLIQLAALTQIVGPQMLINQEQGVAYYQQTLKAQEALAYTSAHWMLGLWIEFSSVEKILKKEILQSGLQLRDIQTFVSDIKEIASSTDIDRLNEFLVTQYPFEAKKEYLRDFLQNWVNESTQFNPYMSLAEKSSERRATAKVIIFPAGKVKWSIEKCLVSLQGE